MKRRASEKMIFVFCDEGRASLSERFSLQCKSLRRLAKVDVTLAILLNYASHTIMALLPYDIVHHSFQNFVSSVGRPRISFVPFQ